MRRNVLDDHPEIDPLGFEDTTIAALRTAFPDAWIEVPDALVAQMDNAPEDRHVLAAAASGPAQLIVTANTGDFESVRFVDTGQVGIQHPSAFLTSVLKDHPELMSTALWYLAGHRRHVRDLEDVLEQLDRNEALRGFVERARARRRGGDGRAISIRLTSAGRRRSRRILQARADALAPVIQALTKQEQDTLDAVLERVLAVVVQHRIEDRLAGSPPSTG